MEDKVPAPQIPFNPYSSSDPSMNVPVTTGSAGAIMSPYLNFDPSYLGTGDSQYIMPEGANRTRGRLELSFSQIGGSVFVGAAVGSLNGLYSGVKDVQARQLIGASRRTQLINFVAKGGASTAQTLGVVSLMYSVFGVILSSARGVDDELNTVTAGTATGLLYKCSGGLKTCLRAGGMGFALASMWAAFSSRDKIKDALGR